MKLCVAVLQWLRWVLQRGHQPGGPQTDCLTAAPNTANKELQQQCTACTAVESKPWLTMDATERKRADTTGGGGWCLPNGGRGGSPLQDEGLGKGYINSIQKNPRQCEVSSGDG